MTPSATTAAGRASATRATAARTAPAGRSQLRQRPAPAAPRRVSGPVVRRARAATAPRHSGTLGMRALALVRSLPEHSLIDRLVRGRAWIPVLGVLLAGIIAMQVEVLKLGTNVGRWVQRTTTLQSQNESLQASVASLNDDQRIERLAAGMGMVMSAPATIAFLSARPGDDVSRAITNIHSPDPTAFAGQLAAQAASAAAASPGPPTSASTTSTTVGTPTTPSTSGIPTGPAAAPSSAAAATPATPAATPQGTPSGAAGAGGATQSPSTGAAALAPGTSSQSSSSTGG